MAAMLKPTLTTRLAGAALAVAILLSACAASGASLAATLTSPEANASVDTGKAVAIAGKVTGSGIKQADVYVDGQKFATVAEKAPSGDFVVNLPWSPATGGTHVIQLKAVNDKGEVIAQSEPVFINVKGPPPTAAIPPTPIPQPTAIPQPAAPTAVPATPTPAGVSVTPADEFANVRSGPDATFERLGQLQSGQSATVKGKTSDGKWLQIDFAAGASGLAWVFVDVVKVTGSLDAVPVKQGPPKPVVAVPPTAVPPTAAPQATPTTLPPYALLPYSQNFRFEPRDDIGDVPLGHFETTNSNVSYAIYGAVRAELEITAQAGPGIFSACPAGNLGTVSGLSTGGARTPLTLPTGRLPFSITGKGYYLFKIYVVRTDGSTTDIPRNVIVGCYKAPPPSP